MYRQNQIPPIGTCLSAYPLYDFYLSVLPESRTKSVILFIVRRGSHLSAAASPKLLDQLRNKLRVLQYAWKTEKSYVAWVERFLRFYKDPHGAWRHPAELGKAEIEQYLTFLAVDEHVASQLRDAPAGKRL